MTLSVEEVRAVALTCIIGAAESYTQFNHPLLKSRQDTDAVTTEVKRILQQMQQQARVTWIMVHPGDELPRGYR